MLSKTWVFVLLWLLLLLLLLFLLWKLTGAKSCGARVSTNHVVHLITIFVIVFHIILHVTIHFLARSKVLVLVSTLSCAGFIESLILMVVISRGVLHHTIN